MLRPSPFPSLARSPVSRPLSPLPIALPSGLTKPTGEIVDGYTRVLKTLLPFEKVVADLTIKARELAGLPQTHTHTRARAHTHTHTHTHTQGYGSLPETIEGLRALRKDSLAVCRAATQVCAFPM